MQTFGTKALIKATGKRNFSAAILTQKMEHLIAERQDEVKSFKKEHGAKVIGEVTVNQVIGGMRGLPGMLYETSKLDAMNGIYYRGHDLYSIREKAPKAKAGGEPIPEGVLWLLLTGEFPSDSEIKGFQEDMYKRGELSAEQEKFIRAFPKDMHAMTQFSAGVLHCQPDSHFVRAYNDGIHKTQYWKPTMEDALDLCAKVSRIAALVYHNKYRSGDMIARDPSMDYGQNFANQMGFTDE
mmetsp:Transcript_2672/g.1763  ORF Transcript_2672/g.1763 Transcript_2672/m.1763 type:complete len:239 (-) Transcript_2672:811-1527(-)